MPRQSMTALFDSRKDAETAAEALIAIGVARGDVRLTPKAEDAAKSGPHHGTGPDERGFWRSLGDLFIPEEDRRIRAKAMQHGTVMLVAAVDDGIADRAAGILGRHGMVGLDAREAHRGPGRAVSGAAEAGLGAEGPTHEGDRVIPIAEEELSVGKPRVTGGGPGAQAARPKAR